MWFQISMTQYKTCRTFRRVLKNQGFEVPDLKIEGFSQLVPRRAPTIFLNLLSILFQKLVSDFSGASRNITSKNPLGGVSGNSQSGNSGSIYYTNCPTSLGIFLGLSYHRPPEKNRSDCFILKVL